MPPNVPPVKHKGASYAQLKNPASLGLNPMGGYVLATDKKTGKQLWVAAVYQVEINPDMEQDVQVVFFKTMRLNAAANALLIEDERNRFYRVALADGSVTVISKEDFR